MTDFANETSYIINNTINFKEIIAMQLNAIAVISRQEYHGGFWHTKGSFVISNQIHKFEEYVHDTREQYSNAVECLHDILYPHFDKDMAKKSENAEKSIKDLKSTWDKGDKTQDLKTEYRTERRLLMRDLFIELNLLLGRIDYFDNTQTNRE